MVKCILEDFKYEKKEGDIKEHSLLVLDTTEKHHSGIDLIILTKEEQEQVVKIQQDYEKNMEPFVKKAYRSFLIEKAKSEESEAN